MNKSIFILPALLMACGFEPEAGTYNMEMTIIDDGCGLDIADDPDTGDVGEDDDTTEIELSEDGSTVTIDEDMVCDRDGNAFSCALSQEIFDATEMGMDGLVSLSQTIEAEWSDATSFDGDLVFSLSCEGADCADVSDMMEMTLPCSSTGTFSGTMAAGIDAE